MGRTHEQTFFRRRDADGQLAHEKMLNIANHQRNANKDHSEVLPHTYQKGYHKKIPQATNVGKDVKKRELLHTIGGNVDKLVHPLWKTVWRFLKKLKIDLPYN